MTDFALSAGVAHKADLLSSLIEIILIDTDLVDPEQTLRLAGSKRQKEFVEVLRDQAPQIITTDLVIER